MTIDDDKFNIHQVNALLFQIISFMSDVERQKLKTVLTGNSSDARNEKDLSSLVTDMPAAKRCELLKRLTNWYYLKISKKRGIARHTELRRYPRKPFYIPVEVLKNGFTFLCFTQNISRSGVFIQTDFSFQIDQKVNMILSPFRIEKNISVEGKIIRIDPTGIGVKFDALIPDF